MKFIKRAIDFNFGKFHFHNFQTFIGEILENSRKKKKGKKRKMTWIH